MSCTTRPPPRHRAGLAARIALSSGLLFALAGPTAPAGALSITFEKVVATGDPAPGFPGGTVFDQFSADSLSFSGDIVFVGVISGTSIGPDDDQVVYRAPFQSTLTPLVREGDAAPGAAAGVTYGNPGPAQHNDAGDLSFSPQLTDGVGTWGAIYVPGVSGPTLFAQEGDAVSGVSGATWGTTTHLVTPYTDSQGRVTFRASLDGTNPGSSMWGPDAAGDPTLVAFEGDQAPDFSLGTTFGAMVFDPLHNDAGQMAFTSALGGSGGGESALWLRNSDATAGNLVRGSDGSADLGAGESVGSMVLYDMNDAGQLVFHSTIEGALVTGDDDGALWRSDGVAAPELLVREGDAAPGAALGTTFSGLDSGSLAETGALAFRAELTETLGGTSDAIYLLDEADALNLILEEGDPAPELAGLSISTPFGDPAADPFDDPEIDAAGNFILRTHVSGSGVTGADDGVLYYYDTLTDSLQLVVREGDDLEVAPGTSRTIAALLGSELNDAGQISIHVSFVGGGQGIFLATIPEPGTAALLALGLVGMTASRRRAERRSTT